MSSRNLFPNDLLYSSIIIPLLSPIGEELFSKSFHNSYDYLNPHFEGQERLSYCGIACACIVLKSLLPSQKWNQSTIYSNVAQYHMSNGIILSKLSYVLQVCGLSSLIRYCENETIEEQFRKDLKEEKYFIIVNYWRQYQDKDNVYTHRYGHFSLVGGFNPISDDVLLLDPSVKKFPHHWLSLKNLVRMMCTYDSMSSRNRGYLIIQSHID